MQGVGALVNACFEHRPHPATRYDADARSEVSELGGAQYASCTRTNGAGSLDPSKINVDLSTFITCPLSCIHCVAGTVSCSWGMLGATIWVSSAYPWAPTSV